MIRIAIVVPYAGMADLARQVFQEHTVYMRTHFHDLTEYSLEILVAATTEDALKAPPDCDAMIARGGTYQDLCQSGSSVPLVELIINGSDIVNILLKLRREFGTAPAAILGSQNMILGIEKLARQLEVDVTPYFLQANTRQEILQNVEKALADGKKIVIGGMTGCRLAEENGLVSLLITSGHDAFWNAISEAKQLAKISLEAREKALALQTLLDNAYEGLVAIDRNNCIFFINASAIRILQLSSRELYIGKKFSEAFLSPHLNRIISASGEYIDEIIEYKNTHLSVKKVNLFMHSSRIGSVLTILNASQIQATEDKLRGKLYHKGHVAKYRFEDLVTASPCMLACIQEAKAYAKTDSNIMIVGESGTGKELMSQSIHNQSPRAKYNFVAVNCAALPENLLESELFGYAEGAFTGASKGGKAGLFEIAHNGTIFLDEISEIPLGLQGRLLRVLQEREIMRLGDSKVTPVNIRIIAATNRNLEELIRAGKFRLDLYYRLYVLQINLPPLRERSEDIPLLVDAFIQQFRRREGFRANLELSHEDYALLQAQPWHGNIRELRNFCERLAVLYQPGTPVSHLLTHLLKNQHPALQTLTVIRQKKKTRTSADFYAEALAVLEDCQGNKTLAAERLGISRVTLWRLLKQHEEAEQC